MKTADLTGLALDWAVENALPEPKNTLELLDRCIYNGFNPSTNWSQGGPIIQREKISTVCQCKGTITGQEGTTLTWAYAMGDRYTAYAGIYYTQEHECEAVNKTTITAEGPTPLIAAMRVFVASRLGDEVEIPEELK